jgi:hypothetical protein
MNESPRRIPPRFRLDPLVTLLVVTNLLLLAAGLGLYARVRKLEEQNAFLRSIPVSDPTATTEPAPRDRPDPEAQGPPPSRPGPDGGPPAQQPTPPTPDRLQEGIERSKEISTLATLRHLSTWLRSYLAERDLLPERLDALGLDGPAVDGWKSPIRYERLGATRFRLASAGRDRLFDTIDDLVCTDGNFTKGSPGNERSLAD